MSEQYTYAVARIRALEVSLFSNSTIDQLIACQNYHQCLQFLEEKFDFSKNSIFRILTDFSKYIVVIVNNDSFHTAGCSVFSFLDVANTRRIHPAF